MCKVKLERLLAPLGLAIVWLALTLGILSLGVSTSQAAPLQTTDVLPVSVPTGQVLPHKAAAVSASNVPSISNVTGATYDADRGEMVVFGIADPALPALDYAHVQENLAIAMRALYDSNGPEIPGVSIEGTLDPLDVIYFGNVTDTHFGQVSFESDRLLKIYTLGKDNLTGITVTSNVTGYMSYPDRMELLTETVTDSILIRYFFTPTLRIKQITTPHTIIFSPTVHFIDWAYMSAETSTATTEAAQGFVDNFNQHYLDYAAERWAVYSDTTLYEMAQLAKLTAVGQWVYDQGLELPGMNTPWLDHYPISHAATVTQTPGITVTWVQTISGTPYDSSLRGGVYAYGILEWLLGTLEDQEIANDAQNGIKPPQPQYMPCHLRPTQRCPRRPFGVTCIATPGPLMGYVIPLADNAVANGGFEGGPGSAPWNQNSIFEMIMAGSARSGDYAAQFPVYHNAQVAMFQTLYIPADATTARVTYWRAVATAETTHPWDFFASFLTDGDGARLATFEGLDDGDADGYWHQVSFDAGSYAGQTVQLWFTATTNGSNITNFFVDDISLDYLDPTPPTVMTVTTTDVGTRRRPSPAKPIATNKAIMTGAVEFHIVFHEHMKPSVVPTVTIRHQVSQTMYTLTAKTETGYTNGYLDSDPTNWYGTYTFTLQMEDGTYDLDVSAAQDVAGNVMYTATNAYTFVFDATSPQVQGISPANGASDMPVDASVVITFSEAINTNTFSYSVSPDPGGWAASWNAMTDVVTLTHNAFMTGTLYTVTVTSAGDLAGNPLDGAPVIWSFTTFVPDTTAPEVVGTSPVNDASEVAVDANIVITFSEAISTNTFSYSVSPDPGGWAASWNAMTDVVTLTHNAFMTGTLYTVTVTAADDLADNPLDGASVIWSFTTLVPDTVVPEILGVFPINNASEVVVDANIVITFSEAISTNTFLYSISPDPGGWTVSWNGMNDMVTLTHNTFMTGTRYTITVTAADDLADNPLNGAPVSWSFTTFVPDTTAPEILGVFPI
ncbi:MAG: Ig-like domain-containing protein, partial [Chloroflexi bacterium]|nr:Ig-like domain-containing protein [Chloroflexota bacterium]